MANTLLNKNTELNNLAQEYSIVSCISSYSLTYNASLYEVPYTKNNVQSNISRYLTLDVINKVNNFQTSYNVRNEFNFTYTYYQSNHDLIDNSLIISNLADEFTSYENSYIVFYNTFCGLKQLSYHYKEGNGLYYDQDNHIFSMNIDNKTIKEINNKLFFDTNSLPISSKENYGISYVDNQYLTVNNGILSINLSYIENIISYKYKIKNMYQSLTNIYNSLSYYNNLYENSNSTTHIFQNTFDVVTDGINDQISYVNISYITSNSLYFPKSELKYIDNYYFSNNLIDEKYKQYITLDENNSYIIYCKDLTKINILSYITNDYANYSKSFDINKIRDIEANLSDLNNLEIIDNNELCTYIYADETNKYNKFIIKSNVVHKIRFGLPVDPIEIDLNEFEDINTLFNDNSVYVKRYSDDYEYFDEVTIDYFTKYTNETYFKCPKVNLRCYQMTDTAFQYNGHYDDKEFKKLGIIVNSKISNNELKKNSIVCKKNGQSFDYEYNIQTINCKYDNKNIKILYDTRNITYCTYNTSPIPYNKDSFYFLSNSDITSDIIINKTIYNTMKNFDINFDNRLQYLFYGYSWYIKDKNTFNKRYYGIWNDLPIYYINKEFMDIINKKHNIDILPLNNFLELYAQNFNNIEFNIDNYQPITLYLYKIFNDNESIKITRVKDIDSNDITINI